MISVCDQYLLAVPVKIPFGNYASCFVIFPFQCCISGGPVKRFPVQIVPDPARPVFFIINLADFVISVFPGDQISVCSVCPLYRDVSSLIKFPFHPDKRISQRNRFIFHPEPRFTGHMPGVQIRPVNPVVTCAGIDNSFSVQSEVCQRCNKSVFAVYLRIEVISVCKQYLLTVSVIVSLGNYMSCFIIFPLHCCVSRRQIKWFSVQIIINSADLTLFIICLMNLVITVRNGALYSICSIITFRNNAA